MRSASPVPETPPTSYHPTKRKRTVSDPYVAPFAPSLEGDFAIDKLAHEEQRLSGARSPRTVVAERLSDLRIHGQLSAIHFNGLVTAGHADEDDQASKRANKADGQEYDLLKSDLEDGQSHGVTAAADIEEGTTTGATDTETSKSRPGQRRLKSPPPGGTSVEELDEVLRVSKAPVDGPATNKSTNRPLHDTDTGQSKDPVVASKPANIDNVPDVSKSPKKPKRAATENANNETAPIFAEALDPDDDGTGINGIGYRPTPAEAWARSQRRKKQVSDWRAREEREARERRSANRRNRGPTAAYQQPHQMPADSTIAQAGAMDSVLSEKPRVRFAS